MLTTAQIEQLISDWQVQDTDIPKLAFKKDTLSISPREDKRITIGAENFENEFSVLSEIMQKYEAEFKKAEFTSDKMIPQSLFEFTETLQKIIRINVAFQNKLSDFSHSVGIYSFFSIWGDWRYQSNLRDWLFTLTCMNFCLREKQYESFVALLNLQHGFSDLSKKTFNFASAELNNKRYLFQCSFLPIQPINKTIPHQNFSIVFQVKEMNTLEMIGEMTLTKLEDGIHIDLFFSPTLDAQTRRELQIQFEGMSKKIKHFARSVPVVLNDISPPPNPENTWLDHFASLFRRLDCSETNALLPLDPLKQYIIKGIKPSSIPTLTHEPLLYRKLKQP